MKNEDLMYDIDFKNSSKFQIYLSICKKEKKNLIISIILLIIKHSPAMALPIIIGQVINAVIAGGPNALNSILFSSGIILFLFLQNIITQTYFIKYLSKANRSIEKALRYSLIKRMQELSIAFHNNFESGKLQSKVLRDVESIEILNRQMMNNVATGIITILFSMIATMMHSYFVATFYLVTIPLSTILIRIFQGKMAARNKEYRNEIEIMSARVNEMVQMIPIARAHGVEDSEIDYMAKHLDKVKEKGIKLDVLNAFFGASTWVTYQIFQFVCLLVTGIMALHGTIPIGDVVMYQGFFALIIGSVNMIINVFPEINRGFDSIQSLGEILECPDIENNKGKKKVTTVNGLIRFNNVSFNYNTNKKVISNFNFEVKPGECIALVGESGAGKSTLMNLIIGYIRPSEGKILLDGEDMNSLDMRTYRQYLSIVPQNVILFSGTIRENILYGFNEDDFDNETFMKVVTMSRVDEFVNELPDKYETKIGEHGSRLSGGQRQRIAIARALIRNPKVIIFDEATSALDVQSERAIQDAIAEIIKDRTTFIIAHRLSTVRKADKIIVLNKGTIAEIGNHDELIIKKGIYFNMNSLVD